MRRWLSLSISTLSGTAVFSTLLNQSGQSITPTKRAHFLQNSELSTHSEDMQQVNSDALLANYALQLALPEPSLFKVSPVQMDQGEQRATIST